MDKSFFYSSYKAGCKSCGDMQTLDALVEIERVPVCKDCLSDMYFKGASLVVGPGVSPGVLSKLTGWLFG